MKNNIIKFQFPGNYETNYEPQTVKVYPRNGKEWTSADIDSHMRIAGFDWDDDNVSIVQDLASYCPYDHSVESVIITFGEVKVSMPVELYNLWIA